MGKYGSGSVLSMYLVGVASRHAVWVVVSFDPLKEMASDEQVQRLFVKVLLLYFKLIHLVLS